MAKKASKKAIVSCYSAELIRAAAAYAYMRNGRFYRTQDIVEYDGQGNSEIVQKSNKALLRTALNNPDLINQEHYDLANESARIIRGLVFKKLAGAKFDDLTEKVVQDIETEFYPAESAFGIPAFAISLAMTQKHRDEVEQTIAFSDTKHFAKVGERVALTGTVLKSVFSRSYCVYYITVKTDDGNLVWFSLATQLNIGLAIEIRGTVKRLCDDNQTQLTRVKVTTTLAVE